MARGGVTWKKQTDPRELTTLLWMTLAHGAAGAMFWQYRPDHVAFRVAGVQPRDSGWQADSTPGGGIRSNLADQGVLPSTCPCVSQRPESPSSIIKHRKTCSA